MREISCCENRESTMVCSIIAAGSKHSHVGSCSRGAVSPRGRMANLEACNRSGIREAACAICQAAPPRTRS